MKSEPKYLETSIMFLGINLSFMFIRYCKNTLDNMIVPLSVRMTAVLIAVSSLSVISGALLAIYVLKIKPIKVFSWKEALLFVFIFQLLTLSFFALQLLNT